MRSIDVPEKSDNDDVDDRVPNLKKKKKKSK